MPDISINWGPVVREIQSVGRSVQHVQSQVSDVGSEVYSLKSRLADLASQLEEFRKESRRDSALQRALTEIIRVRQELETNFGNYKVVRDTMVGILEATDLSLIRNTTIASVTEELMLTTPRYWLAPVLIALSAWISDNKALATRALAEALRRDEEKTCLTFALICRRNGRTVACFEWLNRYFSLQRADDMKESIIAYIDAYTNGVFGIDRDNLCEGYLTHWMEQLEQDTENQNLKAEQTKFWKDTYLTYCVDTRNDYAKFAACAPAQFEKANAYVSRINAAPRIIEFFKNILETPVDKAALARRIDDELIKLVKNYDTDEAPLREEEEYHTDIKNSHGNVEWAEKRRELRRLRKIDRKVNLAERLRNTITSTSAEAISAKKTAIRFMQGYIKDAFREFITENAGDYPTEFTIETFGWSGKTTDGSNKEQLQSAFESEINTRRANKLAGIKNTGAYVCFGFFFLIVPIFIGISKLKKNKRLREKINREHDTTIATGKNNIEVAINQIIDANSIVAGFNAEEVTGRLLLTEGTENE